MMRNRSYRCALGAAALALCGVRTTLAQAFIGANFTGQGGASLGLEPPDTMGAAKLVP